MNYDQATVREVLDAVKASGRTALSAEDANRVAAAYGIAIPRKGLATTAAAAVASNTVIFGGG